MFTLPCVLPPPVLFGAGGSVATTFIFVVPNWGDEKQSFSFAKKEKGEIKYISISNY
jgi:hypothetical protein